MGRVQAIQKNEGQTSLWSETEDKSLAQQIYGDKISDTIIMDM